MKRLALLGCLLCIIGCGRYFMPDRNVKETLSEDSVIGRWELIDTSYRDLGLETPENGKSFSITFNDDGTCDFESVTRYTLQRLSSADCSWELVHDSERYRATNVVVMQVGKRGWGLRFASERDGLHLWEFYGDPDSWDFIEYRRAKPSNKGLQADEPS